MRLGIRGTEERTGTAMTPVARAPAPPRTAIAFAIRTCATRSAASSCARACCCAARRGGGSSRRSPSTATRESAAWLRAAREAADVGWPAPVRDRIPVNVTIPAVDGQAAYDLVLNSNGCRTAKVKVAERGADPRGRPGPRGGGPGRARPDRPGPRRRQRRPGTSTRPSPRSGCCTASTSSTSSSPAGRSRSWPPSAAGWTCRSPRTSRSAARRTRSASPEERRRHRRHQGRAARRGPGGAGDRRADRPARRRVVRARDVGRHRRRGRAGRRAARAAVRLRARDRPAARARTSRRPAAARGRATCPVRRPRRTPTRGRRSSAGGVRAHWASGWRTSSGARGTQ